MNNTLNGSVPLGVMTGQVGHDNESAYAIKRSSISGLQLSLIRNPAVKISLDFHVPFLYSCNILEPDRYKIFHTDTDTL